MLVVIFGGLWWLYATPGGEQVRGAYHGSVDAAEARKMQGVTCPTCHRTSVERVTAGQRITSGVAGGILFSKKARAQFHCRGCGNYW